MNNNQNTPGIINGERVTENVYLCPDGKYRWIYEFPMLKNPVILFTVFRVLGMSAAIIAIFALLIDLIEDGSITPAIDPDEWIIGFWVILFFIGVVILSYIILAAMYGFKYMVLFEMDEEKVVHIQLPSQFKKSEALGWLTAMAGIASGRAGTIGTGMLAATRNTSTSDFINVRQVIGSRWMCVIKVNKLLDHNQIYVEPSDYDFVYNYIAQRCVNAKVRKG
ncbi:hypothetical protein [Oribacterium sp. P6A1]|uniref:hypothetical protein n=1 Tax=Oribacterium sp. P6A1 TaxID=1410612 RepID=UPI000566381E|nr:hypothetical protein [Oribacterium sp. P6A1]